MKEMQIP